MTRDERTYHSVRFLYFPRMKLCRFKIGAGEVRERWPEGKADDWHFGPCFACLVFQLMMTTVRTVTFTGLLLCGFCTVKSQAWGQGGIPLWTNRNQAGGHSVLDPTGSLFLSGGRYGGLTMKISNSGSPLWTNNSSSEPSSSTAMAIDNNDNVILNGY